MLFYPISSKCVQKLNFSAGFRIYKKFFYYCNEWSNSGLDNFRLIKQVCFITVGLMRGDYCSIFTVIVVEITLNWKWSC